MRAINSINQKIFDLPTLLQKLHAIKICGKSIAFTNGVFDLLHEGHLTSLAQAASFADFLVVGLNADASVKKIKGPNRPINNENSRQLIIASLQIVDAVVLFNADTPLELIKAIKPDFLVKGGDYTVDTVVGAQEVIALGGQVKIVPLLEGFSTTKIIASINK
jgi:D-glycero-beta-D-manno-heptose 1-phosphate adenylyltransferase